MAKQKIKDDISTEDKIRQAGRKLFTERGYDSVTTRDIATEAGINSALLSYYFKGKENLYHEVMSENFRQLIADIIPIMSDEKLSIDEIITKITASYIDMLRTNPDLPYFILNTIRQDLPLQDSAMAEEMSRVRLAFHKRMAQAMAGNKGKGPAISTLHIMMNFIGMVVFPFVARPLAVKINKVTDKDFDELMEERKKLIPVWMKAIMKAK